MLTLYTSSSWAFSIDDVAKQAQSLAGKGYETPKSNLPSVFRDMKYADYQQIQFNHDKAYWNNLKTPFKLEFYHQGMYFDTPVKINEVTATAVKRIKYSPGQLSAKCFGLFNGRQIHSPLPAWIERPLESCNSGR